MTVFCLVLNLMLGVAKSVPVEFLPDQAHRIHMHGGVRQVFQIVEQLVVHFFCDVVTGDHRKARVDGDVNFSQHLVSQPTHPDF